MSNTSSHGLQRTPHRTRPYFQHPSGPKKSTSPSNDLKRKDKQNLFSSFMQNNLKPNTRSFDPQFLSTASRPPAPSRWPTRTAPSRPRATRFPPRAVARWATSPPMPEKRRATGVVRRQGGLYAAPTFAGNPWTITSQSIPKRWL